MLSKMGTLKSRHSMGFGISWRSRLRWWWFATPNHDLLPRAPCHGDDHALQKPNFHRFGSCLRSLRSGFQEKPWSWQVIKSVHHLALSDQSWAFFGFPVTIFSSSRLLVLDFYEEVHAMARFELQPHAVGFHCNPMLRRDFDWDIMLSIFIASPC